MIWLAISSLGLILYHYALYPALLQLLCRIRGSRAHETDPKEWPTVTLLIAAYNEETVIEAKLRNALQLTYPADKLEIIVVSDGSSDRTADLVRGFNNGRVRSLHDPARRGKGHALNRGAAASTGSVLLMSDANNFYSPDAVQHLVRGLCEPGVGGISGAKRVDFDPAREASRGDGLYWRYESSLKRAESRVGGTVAADGEIFAMHRALYEDIPANVVNDDLYLTLRMVRRGHRLAYEPRAFAYEPGSITLREDFKVKVRMISGGLQNVGLELPTVFCNGWFSVKFFSHKLLRWVMPALLLTALISTWWLRDRWPFGWFWVAQLACYGMALLGGILSRCGVNWAPTYIPFYFVAMNAAAGGGILRFLRGQHSPLWEKARR